ncbi:MAG: exodeoxyribonuclease V subunit gamma [Myxococcota bacterium]|nr:exodeoxyribonuclease V subunit gamma [Myxococcota bacterium]
MHYSNQIEPLVAPLAASIERAQRDDPFRAITVIVPNRSVSQFLRFQLAQRLGISANIQFCQLRRFLSDLVEAAVPERALLSLEATQLLIYHQLLDRALLERPALEPVRRWLEIGEGSEERAVRRIQLSGRLARLFEEYRFSRLDLLEAWGEGRLLGEGGVWSRSERWQRGLWQTIFTSERRLQPALEKVARGQERARGGAARGEQGWYMLPDALALSVAQIEPPEQIYLFGLSYVAPAFIEAFSLLSRSASLQLYTLNPCQEFWDDIDNRLAKAREGWLSSSAERADQQRDDPYDLENPSDTMALRLWGRPGREYIHLLNELTGCNFEPHFVDPKGEGVQRVGELTAPPSEASPRRLGTNGVPLLHQLQQDILYRRETLPPRSAPLPGAEEDDSLRLFACPGLYREVEVVVDELWRLFREAAERGEPLRFHEVAIMVADQRRESYLTHLEILLRERYQIPYNLIDRHISAQSKVFEATLRLLALPEGQLSREELAAALTHPLIGGATGADVELWRRWFDALRIRFGADERALEETYVDRDVYHWDQGIRRLLLGLALEGEERGRDEIFCSAGRGWLPLDTPPGTLPDAAELIRLARALIEDAEMVSEARLSLSRWCLFLDRYLKRYLCTPQASDELALEKICESLEALREADLSGAEVPFSVARQLFEQRLRQLDSRRGHHQADGVVISSLLPMRVIPFHTVFVLGLGEGVFPGRNPQDPIDLRQARRRPGDVSPSERDRYLFLEVLLSARRRLILSYVAFDDRSGEPLEPSAVVRELSFQLRAYLGPGGLPAAQHPLSPFAACYQPRSSLPLPLRSLTGSEELKSEADGRPKLEGRWTSLRPAPVSPEILKGVQALALRNSLRERLSGGPPQREELYAALTLESGALCDYLGLDPPIVQESSTDRVLFEDLGGLRSTPPRRERAPKLRLPLYRLRDFLLCPLQGFAKTVLRLPTPYESPALLRLSDPLYFEPSAHRALLQEVFWAGGGERHRLAEVYQTTLERATLRGDAPVGLFAATQRRRDLALLNAWYLNLELFQTLPLPHWQRIWLGGAPEGEVIDRSLPPLRFQVELPSEGPREIELFGPLEPLQLDRRACMSCIPWGGVGPHLFLSGFLTMVSLAASLEPLDGSFRVLLNPYGDNSAQRLQRRYRTPTPAQARQWLQERIEELFSIFPNYQLPAPSVLRWQGLLARDPSAPFPLRSSDLQRGPVPAEVAPYPPPRAQALQLVQQRFGAFFASDLSERP